MNENMNEKPRKKRYKCLICGYVTDEPRIVPHYSNPLRCFDYCCDSPVIEIKEDK